MNREYKIALSQEYYSDIVYLSQYDSDYDLVFNVLDKYSKATQIDGYTAKFQGTRTDGLGFLFESTASDDHVAFHINTSLTAISGTHKGEIVFYDADGLFYGSANVQIVVEPAARPDGTIDADVERAEEIAEQIQRIVDQTISALNDAVDRAEDAQEAIENMSVSAQTLAEGSTATVTKTEQDGVVHLDFGIPVGATGAQGERGEKGEKGDKGDTGERGTGVLKVTTAPTAYTTTIGGFSPKFRIALSTVQSQAYVDEVLIGDVISHSYNLYNVGYVDDTYAYLSAATSIRGANGATGSQGPAGSDANVTSANIESALGYMPVSKSAVDDSVNSLINRNAEKGYVLTYDSTVSESKPHPWSWAPPSTNISTLTITAEDSAGICYVISQLKTEADNSGVASMSIPFDAGAAFLSNISAVYNSDKMPLISIRGTSPNPLIRYLMINNLWADSTGLSGAEMGYWDGLYHIEIVIGKSTITIIVEKK